MKLVYFGVALCKCGVDMMNHMEDDYESTSTLSHPFTASGTKYRCEQDLGNGFFCALPGTHEGNGVPHGPVMGESWIDDV